jgi:serine protease
VIAAAGNSNSQQLVVPADCAGVVKVAAIGPDSLPANYSNCDRIDVAAPGGEQRSDSAAALDSSANIAPVCKGSLGSTASTFDGVYSISSRRGSQVGENYSHKAGTSMAAPHVAGVAGLMRSVFPGLTPATFDALLLEGRLTYDPRDKGIALPSSIASQYATHYGAGVIDAFASVRVARELAGGATPAAAIVPRLWG